MVKIEDSALSINLNTIKDDFKIGLVSSSVKDRIVYIKEYNDRTIMVLKLFEKGDDYDYVDAPWQHDNVPGSAVQIFCGGNWGFSEMEVHAPVAKNGSFWSSHLKSRIFIIDILNSTGADIVPKILNTEQDEVG